MVCFGPSCTSFVSVCLYQCGLNRNSACWGTNISVAHFSDAPNSFSERFSTVQRSKYCYYLRWRTASSGEINGICLSTQENGASFEQVKTKCQLSFLGCKMGALDSQSRSHTRKLDSITFSLLGSLTRLVMLPKGVCTRVQKLGLCGL